MDPDHISRPDHTSSHGDHTSEGTFEDPQWPADPDVPEPEYPDIPDLIQEHYNTDHLSHPSTMPSAFSSLDADLIPSDLDPPLLRSPLYSADAMVLLAPHLIDAISGSLPADAWDYMSIPIPTVSSTPQADASAPSQPEYHLTKDGIRGYAVLEILQTERNYYKDLGVIKNICRQRLIEREILNKISINKIFAGMDELFALHTNFLADMEETMSVESWNPLESSIGTLFLEHKDEMSKHYISYINNYSAATKTMEEEEAGNAEFRKFLVECTKTEEVKHGLKDLLLRPMQRMTKYPLLIKELDKKTPADHPDSQSLKTAMATMSSLATTVNDKMAEMIMLLSLFKAFDDTQHCPPTLLTSKRRCILSVDALDRSNKNIHLFLCSDLLMVVTVQKQVFGKSKQMYSFLRWLDLQEVTLEELPNDWIKITITEDLRRPNSLTTPNFSPTFEFKIEGAHEFGSQRKDFLRAIHNEMKTLRQEAGLPATSLELLSPFA
ncbi:Dbl homology domain-containing protein [Chytridium lagenaria]|nr:Dbl homology domain-containing protein [Chytridium lagenaria]